VVDRILMDGDRITIWAAGDSARVIHSDTLSGADGKTELKDKLKALAAEGETADFAGALRDAASRLSQAGSGRLAYTMLVTASAVSLEPALGSARDLFRWFRSERYSRWQVLVVAPDIGSKVRQSAAAYMSSRR